MTESVIAYLFRDGSFAPAGNTVVCVANRAAVEAALGAGRLEVLFAGAAIYTNWRLKVDYIGVWGARNTSRLRTLLRACGVDLAIARGRPPGTRLRYFTQSRHTDGRSRRLARSVLQSVVVQNS